MAGMEDQLVSMEMTRERRKVIGKKEAGQASGGHDQPGIATEEAEEMLSIVIHEKASSSSSTTMYERYKSLKDALNEKTTEDQTPMIQRVPFILRDHKKFDKYFEPRVVAIGPLHHGKPHLQLAEKLKLKLAAQFVIDSGMGEDVLYSKIWKEIKALKACFDQKETKSYSDEELAWMLFVDGCAVLQSIKYWTTSEKLKEEKIEKEPKIQNDPLKELKIKKDPLKELKIKKDQLAFVQQDLFLLENQLPFRVLELLISLNPKKWRADIEKFISMSTMAPEHQQQQEENMKETPTHLLELLRAKLLRTSKKQEPNNEADNWQSFRNVKELKAAGIYLTRSQTSSLTDISFIPGPFRGHLKLPPIRIDDSTGPTFLNLIAYEMCPDFDNDFGVTSYICFLDSLIDQAEDVMELRNSRILYNFLGSDEEVAQLFNEISTDLVPNRDTYKEVKNCIQKHYDNKFMTWTAQFYHDHFSSPWSILALLGALAALGLTIVQTFR